MANPPADRKAPGTSLLDVPFPWLFPGRRPGSPLTEDALAQRLHSLGISPRQGRNIALFSLAADVPAAILGQDAGHPHQGGDPMAEDLRRGLGRPTPPDVGSRLEH